MAELVQHLPVPGSIPSKKKTKKKKKKKKGKQVLRQLWRCSTRQGVFASLSVAFLAGSGNPAQRGTQQRRAGLFYPAWSSKQVRKAGKWIHALKEWVREADCPPLTALHFRRSARLHRQALGLAHQPKYFLYFPKYPHLASSKEGVQTHVTRKSALKVAKVALSTGSVNQPKIEQPEHKSGDGGRWRPHCLPSLYPPCMHRDSLWPQLEGHSKVPFNRHAQSPFLAGYGQAPTT
jgi:hypothetical protein